MFDIRREALVGSPGMADAAEYLLRAAALESIVVTLRQEVDVDRCTLRLDVAGEYFPVVHESRTASTGTLIGDRGVSLQGQPVVTAILAGAEQVVQRDCPSASDDPAFQAMLAHYGGLGAQIVTPVRDGASLVGIISLHHLGGPRDWSARELALGRAGATLVRRLMAGAPEISAATRRPG
jgi:GAF domain-containing protein